MKALILVLASIMFISTTRANETDAVHARLSKSTLPEVGAVIDQEVNRRMQVAAQTANIESLDQSQTCSPSALSKALGQQLRQIFWGKVEMWAVKNESLAGIQTRIENSIYKTVPAYKNLPTHLPATLGMAKTFLVHGVLVSSDKMGHFFDEGYAEHMKLLLTNNVQGSLDYGNSLENGFFGKYTTGIMSYADEVANFNGMIFWNSIFPDAKGPLTKQPYFDCINDEWVLVRNFSWAEYSDSAWDEGINCNAYNGPEYSELVATEVRKLEQESGKRLQCPIAPRECDDIRKKYRKLEADLKIPGLAKELISPICLRMPNPELIVEWQNSQYNQTRGK